MKGEPLTSAERVHAAHLLEQCREILSCRGCNDFPAPNTDENWSLCEAVQAWALGVPVPEVRHHRDYQGRPTGERTLLADWMLAGFIAARLRGEV